MFKTIEKRPTMLGLDLYFVEKDDADRRWNLQMIMRVRIILNYNLSKLFIKMNSFSWIRENPNWLKIPWRKNSDSTKQTFSVLQGVSTLYAGSDFLQTYIVKTVPVWLMTPLYMTLVMSGNFSCYPANPFFLFILIAIHALRSLFGRSPLHISIFHFESVKFSD